MAQIISWSHGKHRATQDTGVARWVFDRSVSQHCPKLCLLPMAPNEDSDCWGSARCRKSWIWTFLLVTPYATDNRLSLRQFSRDQSHWVWGYLASAALHKALPCSPETSLSAALKTFENRLKHTHLPWILISTDLHQMQYRQQNCKLLHVPPPTCLNPDLEIPGKFLAPLKSMAKSLLI